MCEQLKAGAKTYPKATIMLSDGSEEVDDIDGVN